MKAIRVLVGISVLVLGACGGDSSSKDEGTPSTGSAVSTTAATTSTAPPTTVPVSDLDRARAAIDSWNTLDVEAFLSYFSDAGTLDGHLADTQPVRDQIGFFMGLGDVVEIQECDYDARDRAVCTAVTRDLLSGPAGMVHEGRWVFEFDDEGLVSAFSWFNVDNSKNEFVVHMVGWLETAHPDVWEAALSAGGRCAAGAVANCHATWYATPEAAAALLEFGAEFIDQSDRYSIES